MTWIDTHCHLNVEPLGSHCDAVLDRARAVGVERVIVPAYDPASWAAIEALQARPGVFAAFGVHPWVASEHADMTRLSGLLRRPGAVAVGEIGLDFKIPQVEREVQTEVFVRHLDLAMAHDLPVILHCRGAFDDMLDILTARRGRLRGVIHAFSRGPELARRFLDCGMHLAFGGGVTRARADRVRKSAVFCPLDRLLLETDAPSIALEGRTADQVEPAHIPDIARVVADLRGMDLETLAEESTRHAERLFALPA